MTLKTHKDNMKLRQVTKIAKRALGPNAKALELKGDIALISIGSGLHPYTVHTVCRNELIWGHYFKTLSSAVDYFRSH